MLKKKLNQESTIYINDIFIMDKEVIKHRERIRRILKKLQKIGLQIKQSKCEFEKLEIEILGRIINKKEIRPNPKHL